MLHPRSRFFLALVFLVLCSSAAWAVTRQPVTADRGMVVTSQHIASDVGVQILKDGGNAVDAPRIHHQWLPDQITVEPFALSADTAKLLTDSGYKIVVQVPWGAAEAILIGPQVDIIAAQGATSNDAMVASKPVPGKLYGAHDDRRPAGSAVGF